MQPSSGGFFFSIQSFSTDCIEKKPPEDGCMEPKHVVEEEQEI
jgi:hypothetical protein